MGKLPPKPNDPWHPDRIKAEKAGIYMPLVPPSTTETKTGGYSPCGMPPPSPDPEVLNREEQWGPALDPSSSSSASGSSDSDEDSSPSTPKASKKRKRYEEQ
ncbi:Uu.00g070420.m01.CDS01 [Anthostomella pinea]|uniref:Uu.00g070420.m01.CDS01 n=1 Tax=Anthostomella pinea TaxID=933095 RepID=A0AAI8YL93_9PEZI|nr:Uu.00g070420.m01.CDS01 [Anthostomella pinea]